MKSIPIALLILFILTTQAAVIYQKRPQQKLKAYPTTINMPVFNDPKSSYSAVKLPNNNRAQGKGSLLGGQGNSLNGNLNQLLGKSNIMLGETNMLKGDKNSINGSSNTVAGGQNNIKG